MEQTKRPGFTIDLKKPYKPGYVTCVVITPYKDDGSADVDNKLERDVGRDKALQLTADLLRYCNAPEQLIEAVRALRQEGDVNEKTVSLEELKQRFEARLRETLPLCQRFGYYPTRFVEMLNTFGDVAELATRLVSSGELQTGLKRLAKEGHLELSLEHIMLEPQFKSLFDATVLEAARWRRDQAAREVQA
jgi:hypothetical protein